MELSHEEIHRYSRHFVLPEIGEEGQKKIKSARVLLVGAGGLGSSAGIYMAAAGVGTIGIVDFDVVDVTNLHRQILHATSDIGRKKIDSARETITALNPNVTVQTFDARLTSKNALEIFSGYDLIVDGTDNFTSRYLINDAAVLLGIPTVYGSVFRFEGEVSVFDAKRGPCYRCFHPAFPPPELIPNCVEGGVLGVLPGIIGSLQALEALKIILHKGDALIGRVLLFDALQLKFSEIRLEKNYDCPVCGKDPTIRELSDITIMAVPSPLTKEHEISVEQLYTKLESGEHPFILDVREEHEYRLKNIHGYVIPLNELNRRVHELDPGVEIIIHCDTGVRSTKAIALLRSKGFTNIKNLLGGIQAWNNHIQGLA